MTRRFELDREDGAGLAARGASESSSAPAIDLDGLLERCMGNLDFVERVLQKFQEWFPQELAELERALKLEDAEQLGRTAHRIRGNSANISAAGLEHAAAEIETLCRSGRLEEIPKQVDCLRNEWARYLAQSPSMRSGDNFVRRMK